MKKLARILALTLVVISLSLPAYAWDRVGIRNPFFMRESTQLANLAQLTDQVRQAIEQTKLHIDKYANMLQNTLKLPQQTWNDFTEQFAELKKLAESSLSLTFDAEYKSDKFLDNFPAYQDLMPENFHARYAQLRKEIVGFYEQLLKQNQKTQEMLKDDADVLADLANMAGDTEGQHQAIQAASQIATFTAQHLSKLHTTMLRHIEERAVFREKLQEREDLELQMRELAHGEIPTYTKPQDQHDGR